MFPPPVVMPAQVPTSFEMWRSDPMNLAKINQPPEAAMAPNLPAMDKTLQPQPSPLADSFVPPVSGPEPVAPQVNLGGSPTPQLNAPPAAGFNPSGIMPKRPTSPYENMGKGKFALMGLATLADNIGAALSHGTPTVGKEWLGELANTREKQQQYDQNAPKLAYDLKNQVQSDALRNAAVAASTAHTVQETKNMAGLPSPMDQRKMQFIDEWTKNVQGGQYSPDAASAAITRAAQYHKIDLTPDEIKGIVSGPVPPPKFEFKSGAIEPVTYKGVRYGPKPTAGEPAEIAQARKEATDALNQSISTDKQKAQNKVQVTINSQMGDPNSEDHKALISTVANGDMGLTSAFPRTTAGPARDRLIAEIKAVNPQWSESDFDVKKKTREDATSGALGVQLRAIATTRKHVSDVLTPMASALDNGDWQTANKLGNALGVQFGNDKVTNYRIAADAVGAEAAKAFDGAGFTQSERDEAKGKLSDQLSKSQFKGAIKTMDALLEGKQRAAQETYDQNMKGNPNFGGATSGGASHIVYQGGKRIGTATAEQQKKGEYTPD